MGNNASPEEKLLRLIKGQKHKDISAKEAPRIQPAPVEVKPPAKTPLLGQLRRIPGFFTLDRSIMISFMLSLLYLAVSLTGVLSGYRKVDLSKIAGSVSASIDTRQETDSGQKEGKRPFEFYAQSTAGRNIFTTETDSAEKTQKPENAINNESLKDLNVVGIIADQNPQVIIEDKKTQKTHYLSKGQSIEGFVIEEIQENKIILSNKGQRFELGM